MLLASTDIRYDIGSCRSVPTYIDFFHDRIKRPPFEHFFDYSNILLNNTFDIYLFTFIQLTGKKEFLFGLLYY